MQYKNGSFIYHLKNRDLSRTLIISRQDSVQTETDSISGETAKFSVRWVNPCLYELRPLESDFKLYLTGQEFKDRPFLRVAITGGTKYYYVYQLKSSNSNTVIGDTLWVRTGAVSITTGSLPR